MPSRLRYGAGKRALYRFWWYPFDGFLVVPSKIPSKHLDSTVFERTSQDSKKEKALDFSRASILL